MKMKKALLALLLCAMLTFAFAVTACKTNPGKTSGNTSEPDTSAEESAPAYSVTINEEDFTVYETKTYQLTATFAPADATITWTSDDPLVANVSDDGLVTGTGAGTATIRASVTEEIYDEVTATVVAPIIDTAMSAGFDTEGLYSETPTIKSDDQYGNGFNSFAAFNGAAGKYYVATATAAVTNPSNDDTWSRVGISHYVAATNAYYGLQLSAGPSFNARKTVTMIIKDGGVQWGTVTDRSQVWGQHDLGAIDFASVKLTAVRCGSEFYSYINDKLYYVEKGLDGFGDTDTIPVLNVGSCQAEFSAMSVTYREEAATTYLATADAPLFYGSFGNDVIGEDGSIEFKGAADASCNLNAKDHAAKSIGAAAILAAEAEGKVEFDLYIGAFGSRDALPALAVTINRYDGAYAEARSLVIGQYKAGWTGWNSNGNLNDGIGDGGRAYSLNGEETRLEEGKTYHVVFTRLMTENGQDTKLTVTDSDGNVLLEYNHGWQDGYKGRASVSFLCRDLDCKITNIVIS